MATKRKKSKRKHHSHAFFGGGQHRPRLGIHGSLATLRPHSPYKGKLHRVNPLMEVGLMGLGNPRHRGRGRSGYRHNPGVTSVIREFTGHPMGVLTDASVGIVSAYMTIALPNWLLPFPGSDIMSRVLRLASRLAAGGLVVWAGSSLVKGSRQAVMTGAMMGAVGGSVLDFFGTRVIIGSGDIGQTPMALLASVTGGVAGLDAYTRSVIPSSRGVSGLDAYTRALLPAGHGVSGLAYPPRQIVKHSLW